MTRDDVHRLGHLVVELDLDVVVLDDVIEVVFDAGKFLEREAGRADRQQYHRTEGDAQPDADFEVCEFHDDSFQVWSEMVY